MKVVVTKHPYADQVELQFSHELPVFADSRQLCSPRYSNWILDRSTVLTEYAEAMVCENAGAFSVELVNPWRHYLLFVSELIVIPGLVGIAEAHRYSLLLQVGRCFQEQRVARAVAAAICKYFYSAEKLSLSVEHPEEPANGPTIPDLSS